MPVYTFDSKVLVVDNKIAVHEDCCCNPECDGCSELITPDQFSVTIVGLENGDCGDCTDLNGTFVLDKTADPCHWEYQFNPTLCGGDIAVMFLDVDFIGGNTVLNWGVAPAIGGGFPFARKTFVGQETCEDWSGEALDTFSGDAECDWNAITKSVTVTAL